MSATIRTAYISPSNVKGSRVKATSITGKSVTLSWDHALDQLGNHTAAAQALMAKLDLGKVGDAWAIGDDGGRGFVFVRVYETTNRRAAP